MKDVSTVSKFTFVNKNKVQSTLLKVTDRSDTIFILWAWCLFQNDKIKTHTSQPRQTSWLVGVRMNADKMISQKPLPYFFPRRPVNPHSAIFLNLSFLHYYRLKSKRMLKSSRSEPLSKVRPNDQTLKFCFGRTSWLVREHYSMPPFRTFEAVPFLI